MRDSVKIMSNWLESFKDTCTEEQLKELVEDDYGKTSEIENEEFEETEHGKKKRLATTMCHAWFCWENGFTGEPIVRWVRQEIDMSLAEMYKSADYKDKNGMLFNDDCMNVLSTLENGVGQSKPDINRYSV